MSSDQNVLGSVLFLDIVSYSKLPVDEQMRIKASFVQTLSTALRELSEENAVKIDTGDGAAICYLGDPERMLIAADVLRKTLATTQRDPETSYSLRIGINLGPVRLVEDINGTRNVIGDGINNAERVMSFAADNQLLVSKSFYDMVSRLSKGYPDLFRHCGEHADKHGNLHEVYEMFGALGGDSTGSETTQAAPAAAATSQFDANALSTITREYAKYVGSAEAEPAVRNAAGSATSLRQLCETLKAKLGDDDDRYHFQTFIDYYY